MNSIERLKIIAQISNESATSTDMRGYDNVVRSVRSTNLIKLFKNREEIFKVFEEPNVRSLKNTGWIIEVLLNFESGFFYDYIKN